MPGFSNCGPKPKNFWLAWQGECQQKKFRFRVQDLKIVCGVDCGGCAGKLEEQAEGVESSGVAASERKEGRHPCVKMLE